VYKDNVYISKVTIRRWTTFCRFLRQTIYLNNTEQCAAFM